MHTTVACFYVPCTYSLNLVINDPVKASQYTVSFYSLVAEMYNFSASTQQWTVLKNHISTLTLKPFYETMLSHCLAVKLKHFLISVKTKANKIGSSQGWQSGKSCAWLNISVLPVNKVGHITP